MRIYFIGIGGSGLSPLAQLAIDCGFEVFGSDVQKSLGTNEIEEKNVIVDYTQDGKYLESLIKSKGIDWVVYTAAIKDNHPELVIAQENKIKTTKRDGFINFVLSEKNLKLVAIAGTHGKTTTTAMVVWAMKKFGFPISYLIGSQIGFGSSSEYNTGSEYFILEADEFDRNFLKYTPEFSIITNIDFDHGDIYSDLDDYTNAFGDFTKKTQSSVFLWDEDFKKLDKKNNLVSFLKNDDLTQNQLEKIKLIGKHNRENAFLAFELLKKIANKNNDEIISVLSTFPGSSRRMEKINNNVYSDYAHHPTEIAATIQMASEISSKIVLVYQPHQNVRQHEVKKLYKNCFFGVSKVFWLPTYLSRENPDLEILTPKILTKNIPQEIEVEIAELGEKLKSKIDLELKNKRIIIFMGAGSTDTWARENFGK